MKIDFEPLKIKLFKNQTLILVIIVLLFFYSKDQIQIVVNNFTKSNLILNYYLYNKNNPAKSISLNVFEAERYNSAVIVQQLIGNLVYFSNEGRYKPRVAASWRRVNPQKWIFELNSDFTCEDGEPITALSFKKSLENSIYILSKKNKNSFPVFSKLVGYESFLNTRVSLDGIEVEKNNLIFKFQKPIKSGLLQLLGFAPFGYVCKKNLSPNGSWNENTKFVSSGPYKLGDTPDHLVYKLFKRPTWPVVNMAAPSEINIFLELPNLDSSNNTSSIIDTFTPFEKPPAGYINFRLVPEYSNLIILGNLKNGFFSRRENRLLLTNKIEARRSMMPKYWGNHIQSSQLFFSQKIEPATTENKIPFQLQKPPNPPILIEGQEPAKNSNRWLSWVILKQALIDLKWPYKFSKNEGTYWQTKINLAFDLRMSAPSLGGDFEPWGIEVNFCSAIGIQLPDPSGQICNLFSKYENTVMDETSLASQFYQILKFDSAIIPISHFGIVWYVSGLNTASISPLVSVIKFEDLKLE